MKKALALGLWIGVFGGWLSGGGPVRAQVPSGAAEYAGTLERTLRPDPRRVISPCRPVDGAAVAGLPVELAPDSDACEGEIRLHGGSRPGLRAVLVEPAGAPPILLLDADGDGNLAADERFVFQRDSERPGNVRDVVVPVRRPTRLFAWHPVRVSLPAAHSGANPVLYHTVWAVVRGSVTIDGRPTVVEYGVPIDAADLDPARGRIAIDTNGDGAIDRDANSTEFADANGKPVVLRAGAGYVSTKAIDVEGGRVILESRDAGDYRRIELALGSVMPDFTFTDLEGRARKLTDLRGKHVLLDFWGTWCGPCIAEIPDLQTAHERFGPRGFEILGLAQEHNRDRNALRQFVAEKGIPWPQAHSDDNAELFERFKVSRFPTLVLLDSERRIVSLGGEAQRRLRGDALLQTLRTLLGEG